jgi:heptosyltransferase-1
LDQVARLLAGARLVIGVDTGLVHLAAALQTPLIAIFVASDPELTGPRGSGPIAVLGARGQSPGPDQVIAAMRDMLLAARASAPSAG